MNGLEPYSAVPGKANHRPTLTTLINTTDLAALSSRPTTLEDNSLDDLVTRDGVELPDAPALSHELFEGAEFDPSDFLLSRRHTALEDLRSELRAYLATLRTSLVGVINQEYEAFIGLSLGLKHANVAQSLSTIRRPVLSIRSEVTDVKAHLDDMRQEMATVLRERKQCREIKVVMRRLLATEEAVDKVENMLKIAQTDSRAKDLDETLDSPAKRLERIASEYNHMLYLVSRAGKLPFIQSLDDRISRITTALHRDLSHLLESILSAETESAIDLDELTLALQIFSSLGLAHEAEEIVRNIVVKPFLAKTINRDSLLSSSSPDNVEILAGTKIKVPEPYRLEPLELPVSYRENDSGPLLRLYNNLLRFVSEDCGNLLSIAERTLCGTGAPSAQPIPQSSLGKVGEVREERDAETGAEQTVQGFQILTHVIVDEIASSLVTELGSVVFAAGRPAVFHQNYLLTTAFLSRLESLCPTISHLEALRQHPPYQALLKRFQLPVYFQLRFKEAVTSIERAFDVGQASGGGGQGFVMSESESVWNAIRRNWDDEVWLEEVAAKFWKLTLQILSRYRTWINEKVPRYVLPASISSANLASMSTANQSRSSSDGDRGRLTSTPGSGSGRPGTPVVNDEASEETVLRQLTVLIADSRLMQRKVNELFTERIQSRLPGDAPDGPTPAAEVMQESLAALDAIIPSLASQITTILIKRCAEHLKLVRSVASQVRASTRKTSSEPSYFVHNILKELKLYLGGPARVVEEELRVKWATVVVDDIAGRYAAILSTQKKTEDSLRWLKKGRQGLSFFGRAASATAAEDAPSDDDRVKMQMQLDVETLGADAKELGVAVDDSEAFAALRKATIGSDDEKK
ncbi:COG2 family protein [Sporobolomyces koalae]|uniref:COG2 family protein n=1 Tax=Sporobolomyces koalae TaxID=500713 RepID=UPI003178DF81